MARGPQAVREEDNEVEAAGTRFINESRAAVNLFRLRVVSGSVKLGDDDSAGDVLCHVSEDPNRRCCFLRRLYDWPRLPYGLAQGGHACRHARCSGRPDRAADGRVERTDFTLFEVHCYKRDVEPRLELARATACG